MTTVTEPGIYYIPLRDYIADPCHVPSLSASVAWELITRSYLHAWAKHPRLNPEPTRKQSAAMDFGSVAHRLLLGDGIRLVVVEADNYRTKVAQELRDAAYAAGDVPILSVEYERASEMAEAARRLLASHDIGDVFGDPTGLAERTLVWREGDAWCRCCADWIVPKPSGRLFMYDIKTTTNAHPTAWTNRVVQLGHAFKAAWYCRGAIKTLRLPEPQVIEELDDRGLRIRRLQSKVTFRFITQETSPPYALAVYEIDDEDLIQATEDAEAAIMAWAKCLEAGVWPGLPPKVMKLPLPPYYRANRTAARASGELTEEAVAQAIEWARPLE